MNDASLTTLYREALAARRDEARATCPDPGQLVDLVERRGSDAARLATLDHAAACSSCLAELELLRAIRETMPAERRWRLPAAIAAGVLIVLAGAVAGTRMLRHDQGDALRGPGADGVTLLPSAGSSRTLVWHAVPGALSYDVEVTTDGGDLVAGRTTVDTVFALPDSLRLRAGVRYLWWVRARRADGGELRSAITPLGGER